MLNLGGNQLTNVSKTWFSDLVELEVLYLDRNQVLYIEEGTFENLTSLITLHLNSNNLTTLPFPVFQPIYFLGRLYLFRNPWECDCSLEWLKEWMENYKLVRDIPCASPSSVTGLDLSEVNFAKVNSTCVDPAELNLTTASSEIISTTENRFKSLISKLLQQELQEEMGNSTESLRNGTLLEPEDGQLSAGVRGQWAMANQSFICFLTAVWLIVGLTGQSGDNFCLSCTWEWGFASWPTETMSNFSICRWDKRCYPRKHQGNTHPCMCCYWCESAQKNIGGLFLLKCKSGQSNIFRFRNKTDIDMAAFIMILDVNIQ